ncbi:hypothetical protein SCALIN_C38_0034 [Candidatus Scalindua japonica]|uniref:DUF4062 domain-containing protein n=1 Tax=Candidatus Scalindua japonica TaxID=1284222 RepID=A0A286U3L2_9BACT|nr:hypothetical protein [Candidatus Scalindua japonica]GAX62671.1 hypothetical protein SCALIN_C38_0034 [Candidatus Scalindua japonica]
MQINLKKHYAPSKNHTYPIFLSSICVDDNLDPKDRLKRLRKRIYEEAGACSQVYVDEIVKPRDIQSQDHLEAVDDLIERVREANIFICVLGGSRHGSPIKIDSLNSAVSFFEIELYQAALLEKEIHFFVLDEFNPDPRLKRLLDILNFAFPEWINRERLSEPKIIDHVKRLVGKKRRQKILWPLRIIRTPISRLVQALYIDRVRQAQNAQILFLDEQFESRTGGSNQQILSSLQHKLSTERNEGKRLTRLWVAIRELMSSPYTEIKDRQLLEYWDEILCEWARAGAWYGLHGDTPLGCLAALNSVAKIRQDLKEKYEKQLQPEKTIYPGGALASAKYSIAKRLFVKSDRAARLNEALDDIKISLKETGSDKTNLIAIRGSILRQLGKTTESIKDYKEVLKQREEQSASDSSIGEALSELGFGFLRQGHLLKGLQYTKDGVHYMRNGTTAGFLARGLKKLSLAYLANGRLIKAYDTWQECKKIAIRHETFDQI